MIVDEKRLAQIRAWDGVDARVILDQMAIEDAVALLTRARVLVDAPDRRVFVSNEFHRINP